MEECALEAKVNHGPKLRQRIAALYLSAGGMQGADPADETERGPCGLCGRSGALARTEAEHGEDLCHDCEDELWEAGR